MAKELCEDCGRVFEPKCAKTLICPDCHSCLFRQMLAVAFDDHVWGKDCPKRGAPEVCDVTIDDG